MPELQLGTDLHLRTLKMPQVPQRINIHPSLPALLLLGSLKRFPSGQIGNIWLREIGSARLRCKDRLHLYYLAMRVCGRLRYAQTNSSQWVYSFHCTDEITQRHTGDEIRKFFEFLIPSSGTWGKCRKTKTRYPRCLSGLSCETVLLRDWQWIYRSPSQCEAANDWDQWFSNLACSVGFFLCVLYKRNTTKFPKKFLRKDLLRVIVLNWRKN